MIARTTAAALSAATCWIIHTEIRQATMADAAVIADYNLALAKESDNLTLEPSIVRQGVEAVLRDPAKGI